MPTDHPKVLRARNGALPIGLSASVDALVESARGGRTDDEIRSLLVRLVPDFKLPEHYSAEVLDLAES